MDGAPEKAEKVVAPSVAIDGTRIRSIREAKKLTQLYVANVVGVTTDTISRWENNRYPSIKRENAEKLASALEVELGEILRQEENQGPQEGPAPRPFRSARGLLLLAMAALAVLSLVVFLFVRQRVHAPTAVRWAPHFAAPGEVIPIQVKITREKGDQAGFILKERLADGLRLVSALPPTSISGTPGAVVKWLIPVGSGTVVVSYTVKVPAKMTARVVNLGGEVVIRDGGANRTEAVQGSDSISIGPYHWADSNGDGRIDDDEIMPAYYLCEAMKGMGLDWKTIEAIWTGKGYRWKAGTGYTVIP